MISNGLLSPARTWQCHQQQSDAAKNKDGVTEHCVRVSDEDESTPNSTTYVEMGAGKGAPMCVGGIVLSSFFLQINTEITLHLHYKWNYISQRRAYFLPISLYSTLQHLKSYLRTKRTSTVLLLAAVLPGNSSHTGFLGLAVSVASPASVIVMVERGGVRRKAIDHIHCVPAHSYIPSLVHPLSLMRIF